MTTPSVLSPSALVADLQWRYAVKQFAADRIIPDDQWAALEQALVLSPQRGSPITLAGSGGMSNASSLICDSTVAATSTRRSR